MKVMVERSVLLAFANMIVTNKKVTKLTRIIEK